MNELRSNMTAAFSPANFEAQLETVEIATDGIYVMPASVAQQRFWILDQLEPGNTSLNMPLALSLSGSLDVDVLERTLNEIVARHEVLRTTFSRENGKTVQVIASNARVEFDLVDLSEHADKESEADQIKIEEAHHSFDLIKGPLFRAKLIRLEAKSHILLLTLHHIICDGWSNGVLVREIGGIYDAFSKGLNSPYDVLPIQYADFAAWQQEWLTGDDFEGQLEYWRQQLGTELPALEIPTDRPRNNNRVSFGDIESLLLPPALDRAIKALSQREEVTPYMVFLAALNILLHRYCGEENILVGSPTANRQHGETEGLIGVFANTLLLKTKLSGDLTFAKLLQRVKETSLGAFSNQTLPFEKLVENLRPSVNGKKGGQLLQVMYIFQTAFMQPVQLENLSITPIRSVSPGSIFELSLGVVERAEGTRLQLEYNTDLFNAETVRFMLEDLRTILQAAVLETDRSISEMLPWTTPLRSGKDADVETASDRDLSLAAKPAIVVSGNQQIEETLTTIWQDVLHLDSADSDADFFEVGGHSLLAAQLFDEISKKLGVELPLATLFTSSTISKLAKVIGQQKPKDVWTSLVPINASGSKPPLFLMHAAGGNVLFYKDLAARLGPNQPCYGMQAVGLSGHQSAYDRIEDMAAHYIKEIRDVQPEGPYYLGGSSVGGLIAYEAAVQLTESGQEVGLVFMFDTGAPGYPVMLHKKSKTVTKAVGFVDRLHHHVESISLLEPGKRWGYFAAKMTKARNQVRRTYLQTRRKLKRSVLEGLGRPLPDALAITQNAIAVGVKAYDPRQYDGHVLLFRATRQMRGIQRDDTLGWSKFVTGNLEIHEVKGDHGSLVTEPRVRFSASVLKERL